MCVSIRRLIIPVLRAYWSVRAWLMNILARLLGGFRPDVQRGLTNYRTPTSDAELRYWLRNMIENHSFSIGEIHAATGLSRTSISRALSKFCIDPTANSTEKKSSGVSILPYPGGRHPRIGFQIGAVNPQRETKVSIFTPWDNESYIVVDVPEAIWSNRNLVYLAHSHVKTVWTARGIALSRLEWNRDRQGILETQRTLPNGIEFGTRVQSFDDAVWFDQWLFNGTDKKLMGLRIQNCVMLKAAKDFNRQTNYNKSFRGSYIACRSSQHNRWIIAVWTPKGRVWANPYCPCLHSDPKFDDCRPGQTQRISGRISFYRGTDIESEFRRIEATGWQNRPGVAACYESNT